MDFIKKVESQLDMPTAEKEQVLRELASHADESTSELIDDGVPVKYAKLAAERRLGEPEEIAARLNTAHNVASWKTAFKCMLPFLAPLAWFKPIVGLIFAIYITIVSIRELASNRRPIWLATWLAVAFYPVFSIDDRLANSIFGVTSVNLAGYWPLIHLLVPIIVMWRAPRLRPVAFSTAAMVLFGSFIRGEAGDCALVIAVAVSWLMLAFMLFEMHPHGSSSLASFFVLALVVRSLQAHEPIGDPNFMLIIALVLYAPVIFYVSRAANKQKKAIAIAIAFLFWVLYRIGYGIFHTGMDMQSASLTPISGMLIAYIAIMFPIWLATLRSKRNRPAIAR